jgi:hypothetical protein
VLFICTWCARLHWVLMLNHEARRVVDEAERITREAA